MKPFKIFNLIFFFLFTQQSFSQVTSEKIEEIVKAYSQPYSGMAIMVLNDGEVIYKKGLGYANVQTQTPVTTDTRFNLGGLSRQLTVMAILDLTEKNILRLDEKITDILGFPEFGKDISIYHLLTHTSGLPSYMSLIETNRKTPVTSIEVIEMIKKYGKTDFEPGTRFRFSNSDYALLAMVVEKKSKTTFDRYLQKNILRPIGIKDQLVSQKRMNRIKNRATGYIFNPSEGFIINDPGVNTMITGEAGIYMSLNDYQKFLVELKKGFVLNEESKKLVFTAAKFNSGNEVYPQIGLGWSIGQDKGVKYYFQSGPNNAFTNYVIMLPEPNLTIVLLSNQAGLFQLLDKIIYPIANLYTDDLFKDRIR